MIKDVTVGIMFCLIILLSGCGAVIPMKDKAQKWSVQTPFFAL